MKDFHNPVIIAAMHTRSLISPRPDALDFEMAECNDFIILFNLFCGVNKFQRIFNEINMNDIVYCMTTYQKQLVKR